MFFFCFISNNLTILDKHVIFRYKKNKTKQNNKALRSRIWAIKLNAEAVQKERKRFI